MTDSEEAREAATEALRRATDLKDRGDRIAKAWRKSQQDNNFRFMLRQLGQKVVSDESS